MHFLVTVTENDKREKIRAKLYFLNYNNQFDRKHKSVFTSL